MQLSRDGQGTALADRVIVVTGASSGVGYAAVRQLVMTEGATVAAVGRRRMFRIEALARQAAELHGEERLLPMRIRRGKVQCAVISAQLAFQFLCCCVEGQLRSCVRIK